MKRLTLFAAAVAVALLLPTGAHGQSGRRGEVLDANTASEKQLLVGAGTHAGSGKEHPRTPPIPGDERIRRACSGSRSAENSARRCIGASSSRSTLNTASDAEILLIPGLGNRMLGEFKEYRPYKALVQFRREIGKYVDDKEVARLEQYVFVPINLNTASDADILSIPGMGQRMLREFKEYRLQGDCSSGDERSKYSGNRQKEQRAEIYRRLFVQIN